MSTIDLNQLLGLSFMDIASSEPMPGIARSQRNESFDDYLQRAQTTTANTGNNGNSSSENNSKPASAPRSEESDSPTATPSFRDGSQDGANAESAKNANPPELERQQSENKTGPSEKEEEASSQVKKEQDGKDENKIDGTDSPVTGGLTETQSKVQLILEAAHVNTQSELVDNSAPATEEIKTDSNLLQGVTKDKTALMDPGAAKETGTLSRNTPQIAGKQTESTVSASADEKASKDAEKIEMLLAEKQSGEAKLTPKKGESLHSKASKNTTASPHDLQNNISHQNEKKGSSAAHVTDAAFVPAVSQETSAAASSINSAAMQAVANVPVVLSKLADAKVEIQKINAASNDKIDVAANNTLRVGSAATKAAPGMSQGNGNEAGPQFDRVRFVHRVEQAFAAIAERGGSLKLKLSPPELGSLRLEITVRKGVMKARIEAETSEAKNLLLENLPALRDRLAQQDIKIQQFDVNLKDPSSGGMSQQTAQQADAGTSDGGYRNPRAHAQEKSPAATPATGNVRATNHNGQLNVIV